MTIQEIISKIGKGQKGAKNLTVEEAEFAMNTLLQGKASPYQIGAFLISLRVKEESPEELAAFTRSVRAALHPDLKDFKTNREEILDLPFYAGKKGSFHVGISASFIMAGAGLKVVLHGDPDPPGRTSKSMVLNFLGWDSLLPLKERLYFFQSIGWSYFDISQIHPTVKSFLDLRNEIGLRTVFHTIARFINPLGASKQIIGVSHPKSFEKIGETLRMLGISRGLVIRGLEGESEANLSGPVEGIWIDRDSVSRVQLDPGPLGLSPLKRSGIEISDVSGEAMRVEKILDGSDRGDPRSLSLWNAAIGLYLSGKSETLDQAYLLAKDSLDLGKAFKVLRAIKNQETLIRRK
jgi:anthranilate phosphoribosyltransferase